MTKTDYGIQRAEPLTRPSLSSRDLLTVPHKDKDLTISQFGPDTYSDNRAEMSREYSHSKELSKISFRPASTSESISAAAFVFRNLAKSEIFDSRWLQAGYIVETPEGVFVNPPLEEGKIITNEKTLKSLLNGAKKYNGIYLAGNDFGFVPYESFETDFQPSGTFSRGGLARVLEHTESREAENLKNILSPENYKDGAYVVGFDRVSEPVLKIATLSSHDVVSRLFITSYEWDNGGYAFGVLK